MCRILRSFSIAVAIAGCLWFTACGGGSPAPPVTSPVKPTPTPIPQSPATVFFGMHQSHMAACPGTPADLSFPLFDASAGAFRIWGTCNLFWSNMDLGSSAVGGPSTCTSPNTAGPVSGTCYDFSGLDAVLAALYTKGINDVFISLGRTPNYISSNPTDPYCDAAGVDGQPAGMCDPPSDLNADGSGTDATWRNFMDAFVAHVGNTTYLQSHAHILYYEIWSEFHRSDSLNSTFVCQTPQSGVFSPCSYRGTFAQMLRMAQDMRCIVEGSASDPITGLGVTCGTDSTMPARGLDTAAKVMAGDAGPSPTWTPVMQNYLYCNNTPPPNSQCNWSASNPLGSNATDVISEHPYFSDGQTPEQIMADVAAEQGILSAADAAKPFFSGEGSWGKNTSVRDPGLEAAYVPRWYVTQLMLNVTRAYWFAWDEFGDAGNGGLWDSSSASFPPLQCTVGDPAGGDYCTGGVAYIWTVNWLAGATVTGATCPSSCKNPAPGVFALALTRSGGYQGVIVWDSTPVNICSNTVCGSTALTPLPFVASQWRDVTGTTHSGSPSAIGASPIIVENMAPPSS
jgi:hypothetical protein